VVIFSATAAADPTAAVGGRSLRSRGGGRDGVVDRSCTENLDKMGSGRSSCARKKNTEENV